MIYHNLSELGNNTIYIGDIVYFHTNGKILRYSVKSDHLSNVCNPINSEIFAILGIEKENFCNYNYGYSNYGGDWPICRLDDFKALTRVVRALYREIEYKEVREIPKYYGSLPRVPLEELKIKLNTTFDRSAVVKSEVPEKKENTSSNIITKRRLKIKKIIGEEPIQLNNY